MYVDNKTSKQEKKNSDICKCSATVGYFTIPLSAIYRTSAEKKDLKIQKT